MEQQQVYKCANEGCDTVLANHEGYDRGDGEIICHECYHGEDVSQPTKED